MGQKTIETIPLDVVVTVEISGGYYARLHQLKAAILANVPENQREVIIEELRKGGSSHPVAYHLETLLALMRDVEDKAREAKATKQQTVEIPDDNLNSPG